MEYDIAIIGGGPAGYTAAERASENGLKTILFEKNAIGGVCLNEGCIPTKTLLYSAKILDSIKTIKWFTLSVIACAMPPPPKWEVLTEIIEFVVLSKARPLGELDAKRPERVSP